MESLSKCILKYKRHRGAEHCKGREGEEMRKIQPVSVNMVQEYDVPLA